MRHKIGILVSARGFCSRLLTVCVILAMILAACASGESTETVSDQGSSTTSGRQPGAEAQSTTVATTSAVGEETSIGSAVALMAMLSDVTDDAIEFEMMTAALEEAVATFAKEQTFTGPQVAALLGKAVGGEFTFDEVADVIGGIGGGGGLAASQMSSILMDLGPGHAQAIPTEVVGSMLQDLDLGDKSTLGSLLDQIQIKPGGLIGSSTTVPSTIEFGQFGELLGSAGKGQTFSPWQLSEAIRTMADGIGTEICCLAAPVGEALQAISPGASITYEQVASLGADLVGHDQFERLLFAELNVGEVCCYAAPDAMETSVQAASSSRAAIEGLVLSLGPGHAQFAGDAVAAMEQAASSMALSLEQLRKGVATRAEAQAEISKLKTAISGNWAAIDDLEAIVDELLGDQAPNLPLTASQKDRIKDKSWFMKTTVTISDTGVADGTTRTWASEYWTGFTGGVIIVVRDEDGNWLGHTRAHKWGVNGVCCGSPNDRKVPWVEQLLDEHGDQLQPDRLSQVAQIEIYHAHMPNGRWDEFIKEYVAGTWKVICPEAEYSWDAKSGVATLKCGK